jgi:hypothetical protein
MYVYICIYIYIANKPEYCGTREAPRTRLRLGPGVCVRMHACVGGRDRDLFSSRRDGLSMLKMSLDSFRLILEE